MLQKLRNDIKDFKEKKGLDKVIVLWTANTERFCDIKEGRFTLSAFRNKISFQGSMKSWTKGFHFLIKF